MKRILAVDDNATYIKSVRDLLRSCGFEVVITTDPREALDIVSQQTFDLVITDLTMPWLRGDELAARIKAEHPKLPIILMTDRREFSANPHINLIADKFGEKTIDDVVKGFLAD